MQVSPRAWYVQGMPGAASAANEAFNSNAGFVVTDDGVVVVDALGSPALGMELLEAIRKVTAKPVRRVIVTHYHADHFYGLKPLKDAGAEIWAHRGSLDYLTTARRSAGASSAPATSSRGWTRRRPWCTPTAGWTATKPSRWAACVFEVQHFGPAHSPEDLVVVVPQEGVVFSGDILFTGRVPFVGTADSKAWLARIGRLIDLKRSSW